MKTYYYFLDASIGNPIWATADGNGDTPVVLRDIGRSHAERHAPLEHLRPHLQNPPFLAGYFGVGEGQLQPGRSLGIPGIQTLAARYVAA